LSYVRRFGGAESCHDGSRHYAVATDAATIVFVEHDMEIVGRYADRWWHFTKAGFSPTAIRIMSSRILEVRRYVTGGAQ